MFKERDRYKDSLGVLFGVAVGDALGVPVEFTDRNYLEKNPIIDMMGGGTYGKKAGTWSDDSSLTFCLAESLTRGYDLDDIASKMLAWATENYWTADGTVFDIGNTTINALLNLQRGVRPEGAGLDNINNNGNGSLMRILPLIFHLEHYDGDRFLRTELVSSITHRHEISKIACSIYIEFALNLLNGESMETAYKNMQKTILEYYKGYEHLPVFDRILKGFIYKRYISEINSSGYVLDTLEASLWCLFNASGYKDTVLLAVNLGGDTDTTGAVTGGLAGLLYGYDSIPKEWIKIIARKRDIEKLARELGKD